MKMSKSEAGKLGAEKSRIIANQKKNANIAAYDLNPVKCNHCALVFSYDGRFKKFCNASCSASANNVRRVTESTNTCLHCLALIKKTSKYCAVRCQKEYEYKTAIASWLAGTGDAPGGSIRRYLKTTFGYKCSSCSVDSWNGKPLTLQLEHIDGHSENNTPNNLCLLCPNCHSQTSTYGAKNKGNGRHSRRIRYAQGKSYWGLTPTHLGAIMCKTTLKVNYVDQR